MSGKELFPLKSEMRDAMDIQEIILKYLKYWYLFVIGALLGGAGGYLYLRYYTIPHYSISSTLLIKDNKEASNAGSLSDLGVLGASKGLDNEIEVLMSKSLMERVVYELELFTTYQIEGQVKDVEIYGKDVPIKIIINKLEPDAFGKMITIHLKASNHFDLEEGVGKVTSYKFGEEIDRPYGVFTVVAASWYDYSDVSSGKIKVSFNDYRRVAAHYNANLMIAPKRKDASVLKISLVDPIPEKGKAIINKLIEVYNREAIEDKNLIAASTVEFLDERLKYITAELSEVEKDVEAFKRENELTDVSTQASNYFEQATNYNKKLSEWAIQIDVLESIERYISENGNQYKMVPSTLSISDPTLTSLISKFNELQLERERILRTAFPNNPLVLNINEQLETLRENILENLRNIKEGLIITSKSLQASSGQFKSKINKVPSIERELLDINRQQEIKQNLYSYLLQKREETAISLAANVSKSRIIDPAMATDYPISPNKQNIYMLFLILGLGVPFAGVFLKEKLNTKVQTKRDVELITSTPILGEIVHHNKSDMLVVTSGNQSPIVEMFRLIRAKLHFAAVDRENKTILVTSSISGEGKTFFSINLGASLALTGKRVVLVELDLRRPTLSRELGLEKGLGISDYLISPEVSIHDLIQVSDADPDLCVIASGPVPPNPAELMLSPKITHLISELKEIFDYIILDTAPIGLVADAFSLSSLVDSTIYLVRYNYTQKDKLSVIETIYRNKELSHPFIVLNDAKKGKGYNYGYGYPKAAVEKKVLS